MLTDEEAERAGLHTAALERLNNIPETERDDAWQGSIAYHAECLFHMNAPMPKPKRTPKTNGK